MPNELAVQLGYRALVESLDVTGINHQAHHHPLSPRLNIDSIIAPVQSEGAHRPPTGEVADAELEIPRERDPLKV